MSECEERTTASVPTKEAKGDVEVYVDAADRLERTLDTQLQRIENLDSRAGFMTRLIIGFLGVVVSTSSILVTLSTSSGDAILPLTPVTAIAGVLATVGLVGAMVVAIITYPNGNQTPGLSQSAAEVLSDPDYHPTMESHLKQTLGAYGTAIKQNRKVVQAKDSRLRHALTLLMAGFVYWAITAASFVAGGDFASLQLLAVSTLLVVVVAISIHTKSYMIVTPQRGR